MGNPYAPPQYGLPFNASSYPTPPVYPNGQQGHNNAHNPGHPTQSYALPAPPTANPSRYSANAQISTAAGHFSQYPHAAFTPDLFRQFASSSLPPPPPPPLPPAPPSSFPSVPLHTFGFASNRPPLSIPNNSNRQFGSSNTLASGNNSHASWPMNGPPLYVHNNPSSATVATDNAEGNPRDGEVEDNQAQSISLEQSSRTASQNEDSVEHVLDRDQLAGQQSHETSSTFNRRKIVNEVQKNGSLYIVNGNDSGMSDGGESGSSYNPPSASTPGVDEVTSDFTNHFQKQVNSMESQLSNGDIKPLHLGKGVTAMRDLAKGALLALLPYNIRYSDLVGEGLNEQLLHQLYEELGISEPVVQPPTPALPTSLSDQFLESTAIEFLHKGNFSSGQDESANIDTGTDADAGVSAVRDLQNPPENSNSTKSRLSTVFRKSVTTTAPLSEENVSRSATSTPTVENSTKTSVERKDRIAALLALKKVHPSRGTTSIASPVLVTKSSSSAAEESNVKAPVIPPPLSNIGDDMAIDYGSSPASQPAQKAKSKIQTELVRQRMEKLKRESEAKRLARLPIHEHTNPPAPYSSTPYSSTPYSSTPLANTPVTSTHGLQNLSDIPALSGDVVEKNPTRAELATDENMRQAFASLIPGLFMTEKEVSDVERSVVEAAEPFSTRRQAELSKEMSSAATDHNFNDPMSLDKDISARSSVQTLSKQSSSSRVPQKRVLATDHFEEPGSPPAKRQASFQDSVQLENIVHDGGEDESMSEGEIMDIEQHEQAPPILTDYDGAKSAIQATLSLASPLASGIPVVMENGTGTPMVINQHLDYAAGTRTPPKSSDTEELARAKEIQIEQMRKRIAVMEEKRKAKQSQTQSPQPASPSPRSTLLTANDAISSSPAQKVQTSPHPGEVESQGVTPLSASSHTPPLSMPANDAIARAEALRQKLLAKKASAMNRSNSTKVANDTVAKPTDRQAKAVQLRKELARRAAEAEEARKREQEMLEELRRLEEHDEVENLDEQTSSELGQTSITQHTEPQTSIPTSIPQQQNINTLETPNVMRRDQNDEGSDVQQDQSGATDLINVPVSSSAPLSEDLGLHVSVPPSTNEISLLGHEEPIKLDLVAEPVNPSRRTRIEEKQNSRLSLPFIESEQSRSVVSDEYDSSAVAEPSQIESGMEMEAESDGSASMLGSDSEDYEPEEPRETKLLTAHSTDEDSDEYDPEENPVTITPNDRFYEDLDDYEPSERVEELLLEASNSMMPPTETSIELIKAADSDDHEHGLQLTEANTLTKTQEMPQVVAESAPDDLVDEGSKDTIDRFVPYRSPLSDLKSFRFHPQFVEVVPSGYRSLTYSYNIDPNLPLCPTEVAGDVCQDPSCEEQHFRQMSLADEKILVQMSSANDLTDKEQKNKFLAGLKQVIADLRSRGVKEFSMVANELAAYRRRFREEQDPALTTTTSA